MRYATRPVLWACILLSMTAQASGVDALKAGAFDFVSKPVDISVLRRLVQTALKLSEEKFSEKVSSSSKLIGDSAPMHELRATIAKVARSQADRKSVV